MPRRSSLASRGTAVSGARRRWTTSASDLLLARFPCAPTTSLLCADGNTGCVRRGHPGTMTLISTRFTDAYGVAHPIAQAGMAFVGMTPDLAVAVCEAGGLGSLGAGLMPAPALEATIGAIRRGTGWPFNVNFITGLTEQAQID